MSVAPLKRMTASDFIAWAMNQPGPGRYELVAGEVVGMAPERAAHARLKARVWRGLDDAIRSAGLGCEAFTDGMAVAIDETTVYEPDGLVRCGAPLDDDAVRVTDPVIVVEVLSPSSEARDTGAKLADYARVASIRHYLIVDPKTRVIVHHRLDGEAEIRSAIVRSGVLALDPPGLAIAVETMFAGPRREAG